MTATLAASSNPSRLSRQKSVLRKRILATRHKMGTPLREKASRRICSQIAALPAFQQATVIAAFAPMEEEVNIWPLLTDCWKNNKQLFFPRVTGKRQLQFHQVLARHELQIGFKGIAEPYPHSVVIQKSQLFDFAIIPAVAVDAAHYRLGYGGGFYDTFMFGLSSTFSCAPVFSCQKVSCVPAESHDRPVFFVFSE